MFWLSTNIQPEPDSHLDTLNNLQNTLRPVYFIAKIMGLNAIKYKKGEALMAKRSDWIYFSVYLIIFTGLSSYSITCMMKDDKNFIIVDKSIVLIEVSVVISLMFIVVILTFISRKLFARAMNILAQIDCKMFKNGYRFEYKQLLRKNYVVLAFMLISLSIRGILMLLTVQVDFLQQTTLFCASLIKALSKYLFVVFVLQLQLRFLTINNVISSFFSRVNADKIVMNPSSKSIADQLYILCRLHYKLSNVADIICMAFGFQLLVSIAVSLSDILFQAYYLYYVLAGRAPVLTTVMIACPIAWLLDETIEVYWLVYACASTSEHANETPTLLHELRNKSSDRELENEIQTYSLQMLHQNVQFSVLGFFTVDYTLLYSIVGAVTTYLVIFIQFDQSSSSAGQSINNESNIHN